MTNSLSATVEDELFKRCLPLLSALARPGALLIAPESAEDPVAVAVSGRDAAAQNLGAFAATDLEFAAERHWIAPATDGWGWKITRAGVAVVRAARAHGAVNRAASSRDDGDRPTAATAAARSPLDRQRAIRPATARDAVGSLAWLHSRRDRDGQPLISAEQLAAGERLAADLWRARMTPRVTSVWTGVPGDGSSRRSAPGAGIDIADAVIAAKARVERALKSVGAELAGPLIDVCGHMLGLDDIERLNGLPTRSGKLLLKTALTQLARHYGYLPPEHGDAEIARRIAGWMADDGAVTLEGWRKRG
ncbi:MAG: DUF6456 domain-containing protein [Hyphomicrobiaceae bacterium]